MNREEITALFNKYGKKQWTTDTLKSITIGSDNFNLIIDTILDNIEVKHKLELAELEAKVYTYEHIIANSNFAPLIKENKKEKK